MNQLVANLMQKLPWKVNFEVMKFDNDLLTRIGLPAFVRKPTWAELKAFMEEGLLSPYEVLAGEGNLLVTEGGELLWNYALGNGTATAAQDLTFLDNANAYIGVGNSATAATVGDTDLNGASKDYQPMEVGYPAISNASCDFRAVWGSAEGNFAWEEWAVANNSDPTTAGRILNHKVESLGTKSSGSTWTLTVTLSYS